MKSFVKQKNWVLLRLPSETSLGKAEPGFVVSWKKVSNASKAKQFVNKTALLLLEVGLMTWNKLIFSPILVSLKPKHKIHH